MPLITRRTLTGHFAKHHRLSAVEPSRSAEGGSFHKIYYTTLHLLTVTITAGSYGPRGPLQIDQRPLAEAFPAFRADLRRMEASDGVISGNVESRTKRANR